MPPSPTCALRTRRSKDQPAFPFFLSRIWPAGPFGNISPSLLTTGTPIEVDAAVRHLADNVFHKGGKLILDGAFGIPDETPVENVRAMFAAARKYAS